jgi:methylmalonyl-CoA mutase, N-terminal domain
LERRTKRDDVTVRASLQHMVDVARTSDNMLPAMLDAARNEATLGEICDVLRQEWGGYLEPPRF